MRCQRRRRFRCLLVMRGIKVATAKSKAILDSRYQPSIGWPWRFNLRSLFIATTFLAVVLGMIACLDRSWIGK
jgi:hypothetical protein